MIVFGIHCNFFIILPIRLKTFIPFFLFVLPLRKQKKNLKYQKTNYLPNCNWQIKKNQSNSHIKHWNVHNSSQLTNYNNNHNTLPHSCSSCQQRYQKCEHCYFCDSSEHFQTVCVKRKDFVKNKKTLKNVASSTGKETTNVNSTCCVLCNTGY